MTPPCEFQVRDCVETPAGRGSVTKVTPFGSGHILAVRLDSGGSFSLDCRQARPCNGEAADAGNEAGGDDPAR